MTIVITDAKDPIKLTQAEHDRLLNEYNQSFRKYFGTPPSFEAWVRNKRKVDAHKFDELCGTKAYEKINAA